jgi:hypothetical protein
VSLCWHRWSKWGEKTELTRRFEDRVIGKEIIQFRTCERCGKTVTRTIGEWYAI